MIKPQLDNYFKIMPALGSRMRAEYNSINNRTDLVNTYHRWSNEIDTTKNPVDGLYIKTITDLIYAIIINRSYESKLLIDGISE